MATESVELYNTKKLLRLAKERLQRNTKFTQVVKRKTLVRNQICTKKTSWIIVIMMFKVVRYKLYSTIKKTWSNGNHNKLSYSSYTSIIEVSRE